jgi:hypothetical protein
VVRERVAERWVEKEELLRPSEKSQREAHLLAVQNIAEELYAYPTPEYPHLRTFVNEPEVQQKIFTNYGRELTPDIVVVEWPERIVRIVAEVVTPDALTIGNARDRWLVLSRLEGAKFCLYVPAGHAAEARKLLKSAGVKNVALRTWRHITGLKTLEVVPVR